MTDINKLDITNSKTVKMSNTLVGIFILQLTVYKNTNAAVSN
ncbi:hypothetical protein [Lacinutrix sp. Hel_I_90]|nr:hypothetical protein [Lacinutrix sp. Hel_I_90]